MLQTTGGRFDAFASSFNSEKYMRSYKIHIHRFPIYSAFVKYLDFISINSESPRTLAAALSKCRELIANGKSLLVFPEGTRASSGRLLPFKELAFRLASDMDVTLFPVIVHSDYPFMTKDPGEYFSKKETFLYGFGVLGLWTRKKMKRPKILLFECAE